MPRLTTDRLASALGVTRVARVTGLDRCGVEVASAIRPKGHVLQVTQGKGRTWAAAVASALGEAAELHAAEHVPEERLVWARNPDGVAGAYLEAARLDGSGTELVRADAVLCPPSGTAWLGPVASQWTTNGLAAHVSLEEALEHAVLEVVERDAIARVLPHGWTARAARARLLGVELPLAEQLRQRGFDVFLFDLTPPGAPLPVCGALLFDAEGGAIPLTAGYACRRTPAQAAEAALLEAAQSRLTEVHGAREDVVTGDREAGVELRRVLSTLRPRRLASNAPSFLGDAVHRAVKAPLLAVQLASAPLFVVKVSSPHLRTTSLL